MSPDCPPEAGPKPRPRRTNEGADNSSGPPEPGAVRRAGLGAFFEPFFVALALAFTLGRFFNLGLDAGFFAFFFAVDFFFDMAAVYQRPWSLENRRRTSLAA